MEYWLILEFHRINLIRQKEGFRRVFDADLDMRMSAKNAVSAFEVVNKYAHDDLSRVLFEYGDLRNAHALTKAIIDHRGRKCYKDNCAIKGSIAAVFAKTLKSIKY